MHARERYHKYMLALQKMPEHVRHLADRFPGIDEDGNDICYRTTEHPMHHYIIHAYAEDLTVTLVHGSDSTLPGVGTFGQPTSILRRCGCGRWTKATPEQREQTKQFMDRRWRELAARRGN